MSYIKNIEVTDEYNNNLEMTTMGDMRTVEVVRLVGTTFTGSTLDTNFWSNTASANSGSTVITSGEITLNTNTTAPNGEAVVQSVRTGRYVGGTEMRYRGLMQCSSNVSSVTRKWGPYNGTDGAYFKQENGTMYACSLKAGVETAVASTSWNQNTTVPTTTDCQTYEIYWTNSKIKFSIANDFKHLISAATTTWTSTVNLPVKMECKNTGGLQTANNLKCRVATISRLGAYRTEAIYKNISGIATTICKYGPGTLHRITVNSPGTLCTVVDNFTGSTPVIAKIDTNKTTGGVGDYSYDTPFFTGLTIITTGAASDITCIYE